MKLHKQLMNVTGYVQDVISSIAAEAREKGIIIEFKKGFGNELCGNDNDGKTSRKLKISQQMSSVAHMLGFGPVGWSSKSAKHSKRIPQSKISSRVSGGSGVKGVPGTQGRLESSSLMLGDNGLLLFLLSCCDVPFGVLVLTINRHINLPCRETNQG